MKMFEARKHESCGKKYMNVTWGEEDHPNHALVVPADQSQSVRIYVDGASIQIHEKQLVEILLVGYKKPTEKWWTEAMNLLEFLRKMRARSVREDKIRVA